MASADQHVFLLFSNPQIEKVLDRVLNLSGYITTHISDPNEIDRLAKAFTPDIFILDSQKGDFSSVEVIALLQRVLPVTPIILITEKDDLPTFKAALSAGVSDCISLPVRSQEFIERVKHQLERSKAKRDYLLLEARWATSNLQRRLDELEILAQLGRSIISSLEVDTIFVDVVKAAVSLTGAEEGSLMLIDDDSGELYIRAAINFNDQFARTFRLKVNDSLAGLVVRRGEPLLLDEHSPQKISTSYLVNSLIYVPLRLAGRVVGVLGVDNRTSTQPSFKDRDRKLLEALAEYVVIAIHNAGLYTHSVSQRNQFETILAHIQDGVVVVGEDRRLLLVNKIAHQMFRLKGDCLGKPFEEIFSRIPELVRLFNQGDLTQAGWVELPLGKDTVYSMHLASVANVGQIITIHDVTPLKKMDRIKSDFVSTVSHDLRSPLTAILGYVDLLERAGPLNDLQRDFVRRVKISVRNITTLVDDLLDLGRIEAGLDLYKDNVDLIVLLNEALASLKHSIQEKKLHVEVQTSDPHPMLLANALFIRQMVDKLLENAIKYTPEDGEIHLSAEVSGEQVVLKVSDSGVGIPVTEQAHIFEKFYRGSNIDSDLAGTGLGLAIVRSIVEKHAGRVWVESEPGKGSKFFVALPGFLKPAGAVTPDREAQ